MTGGKRGHLINIGDRKKGNYSMGSIAIILYTKIYTQLGLNSSAGVAEALVISPLI
jgi:hypothetical protein